MTVRRSEEGAAAVEFGLLLPLLLLIVGGLIDFGFLFNAQLSATHAAREGVRVESISPGNGVAAATTAYTALRAPLAAGSPNVTSACPAAPTSASRAGIRVQAQYDFILLPFPDRTLTGQAVMRCGG